VQTPWLPDPDTEFEPVYPVPAQPSAPLTFAAPRNMSERTHSQPEPQHDSESQPAPAVPANPPAPLTFAAPRNMSERTHSQPEPDDKPHSQPTPAVPTTRPFSSAATQNPSKRTHRPLSSPPPTPAWTALADPSTQISPIPHAKPPPPPQHHALDLDRLEAGAQATAPT
jgi:hypothetical protein